MKGYIAITTSIILSLVVMVVAIALGSSNLLSRVSVVEFTDKQMSLIAARSCLDWARLKLAENPNYTGNETITVSSYQCFVRPVQTSGSNKIIEARSQVNGATTNLKLTAASSDLSTVSLEELVAF